MNVRSTAIGGAIGAVVVLIGALITAASTGWISLDRPLPDGVALLAGLLTLALILLGGVLHQLREARRTLVQQDDIRQQALALAQCMKDLARRMSGLEVQAQAASAPVPAAPPALAVTTDMAMPGPEAVRPSFDQRFDQFTADLSAASRAEAEPPMAPAAGPARLVVQRIVNLPHRRLIGYSISQEPAQGDAESHLTAVFSAAIHRLQATERTFPNAVIRLSPGHSMAAAPQALARFERQLAERPHWRARLLLGLTQARIQTGGDEQARIIGRLSGQGIGFCLTDLTRLALDSSALKACGFRQVQLDAKKLIAELDHGEEAVDQFSRALASDGLALVCDGVSEERMIPELIDLGVSQISGDLVEVAVSAPPLQRLAG